MLFYIWIIVIILSLLGFGYLIGTYRSFKIFKKQTTILVKESYNQGLLDSQVYVTKSLNDAYVSIEKELNKRGLTLQNPQSKNQKPQQPLKLIKSTHLKLIKNENKTDDQ